MKLQTTPPSMSLLVLLSFIFNVTIAQVADVSDVKFEMDVQGHILKIPVYSNQDIFMEDQSIDKLIIVIQGSNRNAGPYLENMIIAANTVPVSSANTLIVAPQFLIEEDINFHSLDAQHLYWSNGGWKSGSNSKDEFTNPRPARIPSYAVLDRLLVHLAEQFPSLESIVFTGHSAGGQVTQRMAATSPTADLLCNNYGISTRFVVINPSSYVYVNGERRVPGSLTEFAIPVNPCAKYNEWKYGLEDLYTYPETFGVDSIRNMYKRRSVTYLLGEDDDNPNSSSLDTDCEAMLQGAHRYERGEVYFNYMKHYYGDTIIATQEFVPVPNAGHNSLDMFSSPEGIHAIFEKEFTACDVTVSISPQAKDEVLVDIFPNPASNVLNISVIPFSDKKLQAFVYDLKGHLISTQTISSQDEINTSSLNSGMYFLLIQSEQIKFYKNFVVD